MTPNLRPYPEYWNSGLHWLGAVPEHWDIARTKRHFRLRIDKSSPGHGLELLSIYTHIGVRPRKDLEEKGNKATTTDGYWLVSKGDIIVNKLLAWMGAVGVSHYDGVTSPAYDILKTITNHVEPDFYHYLFRTKTYLQQFKNRSRGIMDMRLRLYFDQFGQIPLLVPPKAEQRAIVKFLDAHSKIVNRFICNRRQLIEVLNEQKQAIIDRAITRGLDPGVRLKPSGIDWLGDVPEHWEVKPLKWWAAINQRVLSETTDPEYQFAYIDIGAVGTGFLIEHPERIRFGKAPSRARRILRQGDTIVSTVRTYLKAVYFVHQDVQDLIASTGFAVLSPRDGVVPEAMSLALQSKTFVDNVTANSVGIAYPAIAETKLASSPLALPLTREEQSRIVKHIKSSTRSLDEAIERTQREIALAQEYRTRLITDVVTGKVDVRNLAPDTVGADDGEPEAYDEEEELIGAEHGGDQTDDRDD